MTLVASNPVVSVTALQQRMLVIRCLENKLQELCNTGVIKADLHFSTGQEAIPVGVCAALRDTDYVVTHHRTIAHAVAKGIPLVPLIAELVGNPDGLNGGRAGEMHLSCPDKRFMFCWQLVGTCLPVAAGLAWAVKRYLKTDDIVVVFHGDAATANGQWHEGLNLAAVQKVPLLLVCENNRLAGNVGPEHYLPVTQVAERAAGYGVEARTIDGNQVDEVLAAAREAAAYVRGNSRPFLLECMTGRLGKHKQGQGDLRSPAELERLAARDPLRDYPTDSLKAQAVLLFQLDAIIKQALSERGGI